MEKWNLVISLVLVFGACAVGIGLGILRERRHKKKAPAADNPISTARSAIVNPETKGEILARIFELDSVEALLRSVVPPDANELSVFVETRLEVLRAQAAVAGEDLFKSVIRSHEAVCAAKQMDERAAYGQDPAMYYTLAICGESGEMGNKIVKALRNGDDPGAAKKAVESELPDIFIYGAVLAHVLEIDLTKLVNEKVSVVIERAESGYYGGPLPKTDKPD